MEQLVAAIVGHDLGLSAVLLEKVNTARMTGDSLSSSGPLERLVSYGVQVYLSAVAYVGGLVPSANAQLIDVQVKAISGLYATGDMAALLVMDTYDSSLSVAKRIIFGHMTARHIAQSRKKVFS